MHKSDALDTFVNRIMGIQAGIYNVFGSGMPGIAGTSEALEGAINSGMDITWELKQKTLELGIAIRAAKSKQEVDQLMQQVEGCLRDEQLVEVINERELDTLIKELHNLSKNS